jgi:putative heme transporter
MTGVTSSAMAKRRAGLPRRGLVFLLVAAVVVGLIFGLPRTVGTSWASVSGSLTQIGPLDLAALTAVWAAGLWCHSWVLTAALPGLSRRRALLLNLSSSAVSDLMPFGAAAGVGVNLAMVRSWKFSAAGFASFAMISNLWNVLAKLGLPALVLALAVTGGTIRSRSLVATAEASLVLLLVILGLAVAAVASERAASWLGRMGDRVASRFFRSVGSARTTRLAETMPAVRAEIATVVRRGWIQLTAGVTGYLLLQAVLWWMCLEMLGSNASGLVVLTGFAVERALSMLPFTPGGAGLAEAGSAAALVSLGAEPVAVAASVLLYRGFVFLLEIPVGGLGLLGWAWRQRRASAVGLT